MERAIARQQSNAGSWDLTYRSYLSYRSYDTNQDHFTGIMRCAYGVPANITYGTFVFVAVVG